MYLTDGNVEKENKAVEKENKATENTKHNAVDWR